jgi:Cys-rich protein (TIGR01571 family)
MGLNWYGEQIPSGHRVTFSTFKILAIAFLLYFCVSQAVSILISPYTSVQFDEQGTSIPVDQSEIPGWAQGLNAVLNVLHIMWFVFIAFLIIRTRSHIRRKYAIPEQCCTGGIEDCCCAYWCGPCTICQMARHTADYERYNAGCCTDDGLDGTAPSVV